MVFYNLPFDKALFYDLLLVVSLRDKEMKVESRPSGKLYFFKERCYVYNIFTINHRWLVVIGSNFKLTLRLLFYPHNNN